MVRNHPRPLGEPQPAYQATAGGPLGVDRKLYGQLASKSDARRLVEEFVIPIRSGRAWTVRAGQLCRIVVVEGPQVGDLNFWNLHNPRERFWASRTKQIHSSHVTTYDRLWSTLPYMRPLLTITNETIKYGPQPGTTTAVVVGDVNGDLLPDLVVGTNGTTPGIGNLLYLNDGDGNPFDSLPAIKIGTETDDTTALALGDVDLDGDLDLVVGNNSTTRLAGCEGGALPPFFCTRP